MSEEFYHKNIFGEVVDLDLQREFLDAEVEETGESSGRFNIFALTDAIGARKKKDAWLIYNQALLSGLSAEEIFFTIFWQIKSMMLALKTNTALEADMKPFPYNKAKSFSKNFSADELQELSEKLVVGYHEARRGEGEIETLIEKVVLNI